MHRRQRAFLAGNGAIDEGTEPACAGIEFFCDLQELGRPCPALGARRQILGNAQERIAGGEDLIAGVGRIDMGSAQIAGERGQKSREVPLRILQRRAFGCRQAAAAGAQLVHRRAAGEGVDAVNERRRLVTQMLEDQDLRHVATHGLLEPLIRCSEIPPAYDGDADDSHDRQQIADENLVANAHVVEEAHRPPIHPHSSLPEDALLGQALYQAA